MEPRRLLPIPVVLPAVTAALVAFVVLVALGRAVAGENTGTALDDDAFAAADRLVELVPGLVSPLALTTHPVAMIGVIAVMAGLALLARRPRVALLAVLGPTATAGVNTIVLKPAVGRTHDGYLAYPSGHTGALASIFAVLVLVIAANARSGERVRAAVGAAAVSLALITVAVFPIVQLRYHYVTDAVGAVCWATGAVVTVAALVDLLPGGRAHPAQQLPLSDRFTRTRHLK